MIDSQQAQHTPGPWEFDNEQEIWAAGRPLCEMVIPSVRKEFDKETKAEMRANAQLIAAAPELLKALKKCADAMAPEFFGRTLKMAHAAIAKADIWYDAPADPSDQAYADGGTTDPKQL